VLFKATLSVEGAVSEAIAFGTGGGASSDGQILHHMNTFDESLDFILIPPVDHTSSVDHPGSVTVGPRLAMTHCHHGSRGTRRYDLIFFLFESSLRVLQPGATSFLGEF